MSSKWNIELVGSLALKYNSKNEFMKHETGAYKWAWKNDVLKSICRHMDTPKRKSIYDFEIVLKIASKYQNRQQFRKENGGAYDWARRHNLLDKVCEHMKPLVRYNLEKVKSLASKFDNRKDFLNSNPSAYVWARRNNKLDVVCAHMNYLRTYWNLESVGQEAEKFNTRKEFQKEASGAYEWALNNNHLDDVCAHMAIIGHKYKRALYVYEFENKSAYIGLTFDYHKRDLEHRRRGPVFEELKKSKSKFIKLNNWMSASKARKAEGDLIDEYRNNGWNILNSASAGSLGGNDIIWNEKALIEEGKKYKTVKEFRTLNQSAYTTAHQKGFKRIAPHLIYERDYWDFELSLSEAKKYKTRGDFMKYSRGAYDWSRNNNVLDEICSHMNPVRKKWDLKKVIEEVKKYKTRTDFQKNSGSAYMWAQRNNLLENVYKYLNNSL